jgi:rhodanese-related sulfurtransferase
MEIAKAIKEGTIVDVRSYAEFSSGAVVDTVNVPLPELSQRIEFLQALKMPLVLCCASGNRSALATNQLKSYGIECHNGGAWLQVNYQKSLILEDQ